MRKILMWGAGCLVGAGLGWSGQPVAAEPFAQVEAAATDQQPEDFLEMDMPLLFRRRCTDDSDCPGQHSYCRTPNGECDADEGHCFRRPQNCPEIYNPVCGCDGHTYANRCDAASQGVSIDYHGACEPAIGRCCTELGECVEATEDACFSELCGILWGGPGSSCDSDPPGVPVCPQPPILVQACCLPDDGGCITTTACQCEQMGGVPQDTAECAAASCPGGQVCGGFAWIPCDNPDEFCRLDDGECCCDRQGHCTPIPDACPDVYDPVCGCDGMTYGNRCEAYAAQVSVEHVGECGPGRCCLETGDCIVVTREECEAQCGVFHGEDQFCSANACPMPPVVAQACCLPDGECTVTTRCQCERLGGSPVNAADCSLVDCVGPEVCGGILGIPCEDPGDFCLLNDGECCCDFQGVCTPIPQGCPDVWDPVCGCDGVTYSNRCDAHAAGVSINFEGVCGEAQCCLETGECIVTTREACEAQCGVFNPDSPFCSATSCPIPPVIARACCLPGGECIVTTECQCALMGGSPANSADCDLVDCAGGEVCGGILGIPCEDPNDFCLLNDGECCCDFQGVCTPVPQGCPDVWDPVCGCDGVTYSNRCDANAAGVSVNFEGTCEGGPVGRCCLDNGDCIVATEEKCFEHCGQSFAGPGTDCNANPAGVPLCGPSPPADTSCCVPNVGCILTTSDCRCRLAGGDPVDSCFGTTCAPQTGRCCLLSGECTETTREDCAALCGFFLGEGTVCNPLLPCPIPSIVPQACCMPDGSCSLQIACVCEQMGGVPQDTNACTDASCAPGGEICGGLTGQPCSNADDFCLLRDGECCCDFQGVCTPLPQFCPLVLDPVCGCDGMTYSNRCFAYHNGVSVDHEGPCQGVPCLGHADCQIFGSPLGFYCARPAGACDAEGVCTPNPQACVDVFAPVCGCDGALYPNACEAGRVGVSVASEGPCP